MSSRNLPVEDKGDKCKRYDDLEESSAVGRVDSFDLVNIAEGDAGQECVSADGELEEMIKATACCIFQGFRVFLAWHGVPALVFRGYPHSIAALKSKLNSKLKKTLRQEDFGSKFPKVTLGCLAEGRTLSLKQLQALQEVCTRFDEIIQQNVLEINVKTVTVVCYQCRSNERKVFQLDIPLHQESNVKDTEISQDQLELVDRVLMDFKLENSENYIEKVQADGNREQHYRDDSTGLSLVFYLGTCPPVLEEFKRQVDLVVPNYYKWFEDSSLHCTIRGLN